MGIRKKILLYFSFTTIVLIGGALFFIYSVFSEYREQEYQDRQKAKIISTLKFLKEIRHADDELLEAMDRITINDLYNEKMLIFNSRKELIYSSIDETPIYSTKVALSELSVRNPWFETREGLYDVVGVYFENKEKPYYGISKAYDTFGYSKLNYLKNILIGIFIVISGIVLLVSYFLSIRITESLTTITENIRNYKFEAGHAPIEFDESTHEIAILGRQFNRLLKQMSDVLSFQKHAVHHISHELKTPIAALVSNFERIEKESDLERIREALKHQKKDTKHLSEIINALLEIAKAEAGNNILQENLRIDEVIFDVAGELKKLYPDFQFLIDFDRIDEEHYLLISANTQLIRGAIMNLVLNGILYSNDKMVKVSISRNREELELRFENTGPVIAEGERQFLFQHFFRGKNSFRTSGFGLGLVYIYKIARLHGGRVAYSSEGGSLNIFTLTLPLS